MQSDILERIPPQSVDLEEAILGGILLDREALGRVIDILPPDAFYHSVHQEIYRAAIAIQREERTPDMMSVIQWLSDAGKLKAIGGQGTIARLVDTTVSAVNIDQYALMVVEKHRRRKLIAAGTEIAELGYSPEPFSEVIDKAERRMYGISQEGQQEMTMLADIAPIAFDETERRSIGQLPLGISTGFPDLDALTLGGFHPSDLILVAGRPAMGKTAWALQAARNIATQGLPVAVFSLEMSKKQLFYRLWSAESRIEAGRLRTGRIHPDEWDIALGTNHRLLQFPIGMDDTPTPTIDYIRSKCRKMAAQNGGKLGAVVIDYLQLMGSGNESNRVQEIARITRSLKGLARELDVPVIALSQLSRNVEGRSNKRPMMSDLRESGSIEQDSDLILMLYRDEYYDPETPEKGVAELIISKQRNGIAPATVKLLFEPQFTTFRNMGDAA